MDRVQREFIDRMGQAAETDGMSPIASRLFALLLLSAEPRSLDELADELQVSKASISTDARRLLERGAVERVSRPADRRDYYQLAPNFFAAVIRARIARWRRIQEIADVMRETTHLAPAVRERLAEIDDVHAAVIDPFGEALTAWEQSARRRSTKAAARRGRTA